MLSNRVVPYQRQQQSKLQKEAALVKSAYLQKLAELEKEDPEEAVTGRQGLQFWKSVEELQVGS